MRTRKGAARTQAKKRVLKRASGFVGGRRKLLRTAKESLLRSGVFAYRDRRRRRRDFRQLWIIRITGALQEHGIRYSQFIRGLKLAKIELDRKSLSEVAIHDPAAFTAVVDLVKKALAA
ncbi:MAG: 50S ribosomal protein L20 [Planctomycetes bacterium]|nr:50S ribosomal protein L20 [Planctomycetota bacterium]